MYGTKDCTESVFFFFKQKTAYDMRISDWSSDVCSSDLHDAVLLATGVYKARDVACPGIGLGGVEVAMDYLTASNRAGPGADVAAFADGSLQAAGKNVVVVGGGDTERDCVRTAVRQGEKTGMCPYRPARAKLPGPKPETAT